MSKSTQIIRSLYFYVVSIVALFMLVFSCVDLVNIGLKTWVFKNADPSYGICIPGSIGTYNGPMIPASADPNAKTAPTGPTQAECDLQNKQNQEWMRGVNEIIERHNREENDRLMRELLDGLRKERPLVKWVRGGGARDSVPKQVIMEELECVKQEEHHCGANPCPAMRDIQVVLDAIARGLPVKGRVVDGKLHVLIGTTKKEKVDKIISDQLWEADNHLSNSR